MQTNTYTHIYTYICHLSLFMYILEKSLKYRFSHGKSYKFNCTNSQNLICHACHPKWMLCCSVNELLV